MGQHYSHLGLAERRVIARLLEAKGPVAEIARRLGRLRSTINRDFHHINFRDH